MIPSAIPNVLTGLVVSKIDKRCLSCRQDLHDQRRLNAIVDYVRPVGA